MYKGYEDRHTLYIVEGNGPALVGRVWLCEIQLDWPSIRTHSYQGSIQARPFFSKCHGFRTSRDPICDMLAG